MYRRSGAEWEGIGNIQPDHRQDLVVVHGDVVVENISDECAPAFQASGIGEPAEGVAGPVLARNPDEQDQHADDNEQRLACQEAGDNSYDSSDNPKVAYHAGRITDLWTAGTGCGTDDGRSAT